MASTCRSMLKQEKIQPRTILKKLQLGPMSLNACTAGNAMMGGAMTQFYEFSQKQSSKLCLWAFLLFPLAKPHQAILCVCVDIYIYIYIVRMLVVDSNQSWEEMTFDSIMDYKIFLLNDEIQRPCTPGVNAYTALPVPSAPKAECSLLVPTFEVQRTKIQRKHSPPLTLPILMDSVDFSIGPSFRHIETFQSTNQLIAVVLATNDLDAHAKFEH